jgi:two-component system sensor histidine kinase HupT/HoxJ
MRREIARHVLIACNAQGGIEQTNDALCQLVQLPAATLRGMPIDELLADADSVAKMRAVMSRAAFASEGEVIELNLRDAAGGAVPVDVSCTPRIGPRGKRVGYVFVGRPMGEIKRAYHQLREAHEVLKRTQQQLLHSEKLASLGRLVAGVAHELNNPISFVLGNVHALQRYSERLASYIDTLHQSGGGEAMHEHTHGKTQRQTQAQAQTQARAQTQAQPQLQANEQAQAQRERLRIDHILADLPSLIEGTLQGAQRTADIVHGLKRFSAVDREEHSVFDLNEVVERAIHWVKKGTAPTFDVQWVPCPDCWITGSSGQMLQVLMNLIQNAYDATAGNAGRTPWLRIEASRVGEHIVLRFRDNGPGIADENLARVFDPFFSTRPVGKGTGLGLSISYGIVERHGGRLLVRNHPEGGAEFTLELPCDERDPPPVATT